MEIGLLYLQEKPLDAVPPKRLRALQSEAFLQGYGLAVLLYRSVNYHSQTIKAYCWSRSAEKWSVKLIPIPEMIIFQGAIKNDSERKLREWSLQYRYTIADVGVSKNRLAEFLSETTYRGMIIPTQKLAKDNTLSQITLAIEKYQEVVIKRENSNRGIGLIFIRHVEDSWMLTSERKKMHGTLGEIAEQAYRLIKGRMSYRGYIIQPFITAKSKDQRPVDIRVHMQKRRDGRWYCTRAYARVAEACSMLPNYSKGGYQGDLVSYLKRVCPANIQDIHRALIKVATGIACTQESITQIPLSELGLDFILDTQDKLWLVETNAWPQSALHEMERARYVIEYLRFLKTTRSSLASQKLLCQQSPR